MSQSSLHRGSLFYQMGVSKESRQCVNVAILSTSRFPVLPCGHSAPRSHQVVCRNPLYIEVPCSTCREILRNILFNKSQSSLHRGSLFYHESNVLTGEDAKNVAILSTSRFPVLPKNKIRDIASTLLSRNPLYIEVPCSTQSWFRLSTRQEYMSQSSLHRGSLFYHVWDGHNWGNGGTVAILSTSRFPVLPLCLCLLQKQQGQVAILSTSRFPVLPAFDLIGMEALDRVAILSTSRFPVLPGYLVRGRHRRRKSRNPLYIEVPCSTVPLHPSHLCPFTYPVAILSTSRFPVLPRRYSPFPLPATR